MRPARRVVAAMSLLLVGACVGLGAPESDALREIEAGRRAILLLRIVADRDGEERTIIPAGLLLHAEVELGLGSFATGGHPRHVTPTSPSREACAAGWLHFVLEPGLHYLSIRRSRIAAAHTADPGFAAAPRWCLEVPEQTPLIYAGTLRLGPKGDGDDSDEVGASTACVETEPDAARALCAELIPALGVPSTVPMRRHRSPTLALRRPLPGPGR